VTKSIESRITQLTHGRLPRWGLFPVRQGGPRPHTDEKVKEIVSKLAEKTRARRQLRFFFNLKYIYYPEAPSF
jgi:hypothetical protein